MPQREHAVFNRRVLARALLAATRGDVHHGGYRPTAGAPLSTRISARKWEKASNPYFPW